MKPVLIADYLNAIGQGSPDERIDSRRDGAPHSQRAQQGRHVILHRPLHLDRFRHAPLHQSEGKQR